MITDEMLKEAAGEAEAMGLADLPREHAFSEEFQRRVDRAKYRRLHRGSGAVRCVTLVLVACLTVFGGALALSPEVRAEVGSWFKGDAFISSPSGKVPVAERKDFCLTWIPEGYAEYDIHEDETGGSHIYVDENDRFLRFGYTYSGKSYAMVEGFEHKQVMLGDVQADIFLDPSREEGNGIIWKDSEGNVLFSISAYMEEEQLIRLALSVKEKK